ADTLKPLPLPPPFPLPSRRVRHLPPRSAGVRAELGAQCRARRGVGRCWVGWVGAGWGGSVLAPGGSVLTGGAVGVAAPAHQDDDADDDEHGHRETGD